MAVRSDARRAWCCNGCLGFRAAKVIGAMSLQKTWRIGAAYGQLLGGLEALDALLGARGGTPMTPAAELELQRDVQAMRAQAAAFAVKLERALKGE